MDIRRQLACRWCFTFNNYNDDTEHDIQLLMTNECIYGIYGREIAPSTNTPHLQGYFHFKDRVRGSHILRIIPGIHIEVAKGSELQNIQYCSKSGNIFEYGRPNNESIKIREKEETMLRMHEDYARMPYLEFRQKYPTFSTMHKDKLEQWRIDGLTLNEPWNGNLMSKNWWICGPPRTGKSRWARSQSSGDKIFLKACNKWWGGYVEGRHQVVMIEDFPNDAKYLAQLMKIWADRYTFTAEVKGGTIFIDPGRWFLIVTSNYTIDESFETTDADAIRARFSQIYIENANDIFLHRRVDFNILRI